MQLQENAEVFNADGEKIGRIDRIVVNPKTREVTHVVTKKGLLFTREKVIPLDQIQEAEEDRVVLKEGAGDPDQWPDFEKKSHVPVDEIKSLAGNRQNFVKPVIWYHPWVGLPWWNTDLYPATPPPVYVAVSRNIPEGTVAIQEEAEVISQDGRKLGEVETIYTEPEGHLITHLLVSRGKFSKENKLIPTYWVDRVEEDEVHLAVDSDVVEGLPEKTLI